MNDRYRISTEVFATTLLDVIEEHRQGSTVKELWTLWAGHYINDFAYDNEHVFPIIDRANEVSGDVFDANEQVYYRIRGLE